MAHPTLVEAFQVLTRAERHIGGPFALKDRPVIAQWQLPQQTRVQRMHLTLQSIEYRGPRRAQLLVEQLLGPLPVAESEVGDWQRSLKRLLILAVVPDGHAHSFRDTFSVEFLLAGVPIERVSILLGHQSVRITEKHYAPWVRARQEQLEADVRRTWHTHEPQQRVHSRYTEKDAGVIPFKSRRKNGGVGIFKGT